MIAISWFVIRRNFMLIVNYFVGPSKFGVGLFSAQSIKKNEVVCNSDYRFIQILRESEIEKLPSVMKQVIQKYTYHGIGNDRLIGSVYYNTDDTRFINHSDNPNLIYIKKEEVYLANCDIQIGEELTCNYEDFAVRGEACFNFSLKC